MEEEEEEMGREAGEIEQDLMSIYNVYVRSLQMALVKCYITSAL